MKKNSVWKFVAVLSFAAFVFATMSSICLKRKNKKYRDKIIEMSENFPNTKEQEEKLAEIRKRRWSRAHSVKNRMTDEERIAERRIIEED